MNNTPKLLPAVLVAVVIAIVGGWMLFHSGTPVGTTANQTSTAGYYNAGLGFKVNGTTVINSSKQLVLGTSGTAITGLVYGTCQVVAYSTTISASSTAQVDCSSNGMATGTISGLTASQLVDAWATTTLSSVSQGVSIVASHGSSTAGIITLRISNGSGTTFTWSGAASTSVAYWAVR